MTKNDILKLPELTQFQINIIIGSMLGDGCIHASAIRKGNGNGCLVKSQSIDKEEYIKWHYDNLQPYSLPLRNGISLAHTTESGKFFKEGKNITFSTRSHPFFTEIRSKWYPDIEQNGRLHKKIVPRDIKLNPQIVAVWFADDGTNVKSTQMRLCTHRFTESDVNFLLDQLREFGFKCKKVKDNRCKKKDGGFLIVFSAKNKKDFIDWIKPYFPWDCLSYKLKFISDSSLAVNNTSGCRGVVFDKNRNKWLAAITVNKKTIHLGRFENKEDAINARKIADSKYSVSVGRKWNE